jgi:hypothetical protein
VKLLEDICRYALSIGAEAIEVRRTEGHDRVLARKGDGSFRIANFAPSSADGRELRQNLYAAAKRPIRAMLNGQLSIVEVRIYDDQGEDGFEVTITPAPRPNPAIMPSYTVKQGQYLAYIYHYSISLFENSPASARRDRSAGLFPRIAAFRSRDDQDARTQQPDRADSRSGPKHPAAGVAGASAGA